MLGLTLQKLGSRLFGPQRGWRHADALAQQEVASIQATFPLSLLVADPASSAQRLDDSLQYWLQQRSSLKARTNTWQLRPAPQNNRPYTLIHNRYRAGLHNTTSIYTKTAASLYRAQLLAALESDQSLADPHNGGRRSYGKNIHSAPADTGLTLPLFLAAATLG